jgi:hypothetical protein
MARTRMTALILCLGLCGATVAAALATAAYGSSAMNTTDTPVWVTLYKNGDIVKAAMAKKAFPFNYINSRDSEGERRLRLEVGAPNGHFYDQSIYYQNVQPDHFSLLFYICADKSGAYYWSRMKDCTR